MKRKLLLIPVIALLFGSYFIHHTIWGLINDSFHPSTFNEFLWLDAGLDIIMVLTIYLMFHIAFRLNALNKRFLISIVVSVSATCLYTVIRIIYDYVLEKERFVYPNDIENFTDFIFYEPFFEMRLKRFIICLLSIGVIGILMSIYSNKYQTRDSRVID